MDPLPGSTDGQASRPLPVPDAEAQVEGQIMLAEYAALRSEVDRRATVQWNVLALQLTSAGVIASLAISHASEIALLLVIPLSSYMLGSRYILHDFHLKLISRYIRDSLSGRLGGPPGVGKLENQPGHVSGGATRLAYADRLESAASDPAGIRGSSVACPAHSCAGSRIQLAGQGSRLGPDIRIRPALDPWRAGDLFPAQVIKSVRGHIRHAGDSESGQARHSHLPPVGRRTRG